MDCFQTVSVFVLFCLRFGEEARARKGKAGKRGPFLRKLTIRWGGDWLGCLSFLTIGLELVSLWRMEERREGIPESCCEEWGDLDWWREWGWRLWLGEKVRSWNGKEEWGGDVDW